MQRRVFLHMLGLATFGICTGGMMRNSGAVFEGGVTLFLCGDVMLGRGIDQVLPHPSRPQIHESYMRSAKGYVEIAEAVNGPIPQPVDFDYIWGDALEEFRRLAPDLRLINLETAVTTSEAYWPGKGINYRMHPKNIPCLTAAAIDGCSLANNHVMDWGREGLLETLGALKESGIKTAGAGLDRTEAEAPAVFKLPAEGRVLLFAFGHPSSGVPSEWRAGVGRPGVSMLETLSASSVAEVAKRVAAVRQPNDLVITSIHWGGNWGYRIPREQRRFAHRLIDEAGVDIVHGHSSHHPKGIEIYQDRPIFYGCGDFLNDYEGIKGHETYRDDLTLMYFVTVDTASGTLLRLEMTPLQVQRFRLQYPSKSDRDWLQQVMERECGELGARITRTDQGRFELLWKQDQTN